MILIDSDKINLDSLAYRLVHACSLCSFLQSLRWKYSIHHNFSHGKTWTMWKRTWGRFHVVPRWSDVAPGRHHNRLGFRDCKKEKTWTAITLRNISLMPDFIGIYLFHCFTMTPFEAPDLRSFSTNAALLTLAQPGEWNWGAAWEFNRKLIQK